MLKPVKVDWFKIIADLQRQGFTHEQIAKDVGVSRRIVGYWRDGCAEPLYSNGHALISLHSSVIKST